jgi:hypothetical protein
MAHKVIIPPKKIMSRSFLNSGTLIVNNLWDGRKLAATSSRRVADKQGGCECGGGGYQSTINTGWLVQTILNWSWGRDICGFAESLHSAHIYALKEVLQKGVKL